MSAFYLRPVVTYPARCSAPAFFARPSVAAWPSQDFAPLFSLFDESIAQIQRAQRQARPHFKRPFNPKFDVRETNQAYAVQADVPGFAAEDISIEFLDDGHTLQIKGKTVKETRSEQPRTVQSATPPETPKAVEQASAEKSETSSVKSHQATVEDDVEEPANASAVAQQSAPQPQEQTVAESSKTAEQPAREQDADTTNLISERYSGSFTRSFKFPSKVDQEAVRASLKDGILSITLPFARKPESRRIQIE